MIIVCGGDGAFTQARRPHWAAASFTSLEKGLATQSPRRVRCGNKQQPTTQNQATVFFQEHGHATRNRKGQATAIYFAAHKLVAPTGIEPVIRGPGRSR